MRFYKFRLISAIILTIFLASSVCFGQSFGKNKVSRQKFDWMTYKTTHFVIYYYPEEESLVRTMADMAEIAYAKISTILEHNIERETPLILYKSPDDFRQTNVILETLGEGVGGFAELLKYRIVIPFTGSMDGFQEVITHEITHIFQYDILYRELFAHIYTGEFLYSPPLWFVEGLSEYMADDWDAEGRMVLRDAVINNSIVPLIYLDDFSPLGSRIYLGYKQGQSAVEYLAEKYGTDKLSDIMLELKASRTKDLDEAFKNSIEIGLEKFDEEWQQYVKKKYWPSIADKQTPSLMDKNLTKEQQNSYYNVKPAWSPSGELIAYITYQDGYEEIKIISAKDGKLFSRITKSFQGDKYNTIREKGSGLAWSKDGNRIAFIGTKNGKDYLLAVDVVTGELTNWIEMPFDAAYSPTWSPDSKYVALVGLKNGKSDIYAFRLEDAVMEQLTSDVYDDRFPSWHPTELKLVYSSERNGVYKMFILDLGSKRSSQITYGKHNETYPSWNSDGNRIIFCSDMNDISDVYTANDDGENWTKLTNILTGCFNPSLSPDGKSVVTTIYSESRYDIYVLRSSELLDEKIETPREETQEILYTIDDRGVRGVDYSLKFAPDIILVNFGYISGGSFQNTIQIVASDIMGDHRFMAGIDSVSLVNQPDFLLAYYYLKMRADFGGAIFNQNNFYTEGDDRFWERNTGMVGYLSYPLDQFKRIDLNLERYLRFLDYIDDEDRKDRESITLLGLSFVKDVVIWNYFGPYSGMRYNLSVEQSVKLTSRDLQRTNAIVDYRRYFKLGQRSNFAARFIGAASMGADKEKFHLGSSFIQSQGGFYFTKTLMRGYDFNEISGNRVGLLNLELRLPFVDELRFGWPFVWGFSGIRGVVFMDLAGVWPRPPEAEDIYGDPIEYKSQFKPWVRDDKGFRLVDLRASVGAGFRIWLGFFSLSFDFAKKTDFRKFGEGYEFHFGMGQDF
jgi:Tol biopolymer transport system component